MSLHVVYPFLSKMSAVSIRSSSDVMKMKIYSTTYSIAIIFYFSHPLDSYSSKLKIQNPFTQREKRSRFWTTLVQLVYIFTPCKADPIRFQARMWTQHQHEELFEISRLKRWKLFTIGKWTRDIFVETVKDYQEGYGKKARTSHTYTLLHSLQETDIGFGKRFHTPMGGLGDQDILTGKKKK